jgi:hypothetical protein
MASTPSRTPHNYPLSPCNFVTFPGKIFSSAQSKVTSDKVTGDIDALISALWRAYAAGRMDDAQAERLDACLRQHQKQIRKRAS